MIPMNLIVAGLKSSAQGRLSTSLSFRADGFVRPSEEVGGGEQAGDDPNDDVHACRVPG
jgi:hypothetical protein